MTLWWLLAIPLLWLGLRWFERVNLFFPGRGMEADPGALGLHFEDLRLTAEGEKTLKSHRQRRRKMLEQLLANVTSKDQKRLDEILQHLLAAMQNQETALPPPSRHERSR